MLEIKYVVLMLEIRKPCLITFMQLIRFVLRSSMGLVTAFPAKWSAGKFEKSHSAGQLDRHFLQISSNSTANAKIKLSAMYFKNVRSHL